MVHKMGKSKKSDNIFSMPETTGIFSPLSLKFDQEKAEKAQKKRRFQRDQLFGAKKPSRRRKDVNKVMGDIDIAPAKDLSEFNFDRV